MPTSKYADRREGALLYTSQRLGETGGTITPAQVLRELRSTGRGYRKTEFLKDYAGITGKPQTINPAAIKGGIVSGVSRQRAVKALPKHQQDAIKAISRAAVDATVATGDKPRNAMQITTLPGKTQVSVEIAASWETGFLDIEEGGQISDNINIANVDIDNIPIMFDIMDHIYDRLT